MGVRPINDDHAIESVSFTLGLNCDVGNLLSEKMVPHAKKLMLDLPAVAAPRSFNKEAQPQPNTPPYGGVEFCRYRPNGSSVWLARIVGSEISVECTRYTRWINIWGTAREYLQTLISALADTGIEIHVASVMMTIQDIFVAEEGASLKSVFQQHVLSGLPSQSEDNLWHLHKGWFEARSAGRTLNRLHFDTLSHSDEFGFTQDNVFRVAINHFQKVELPDGTLLSSCVDVVSQVVEEMHAKNKATLKDVIDPRLSDTIGLNLPEGS